MKPTFLAVLCSLLGALCVLLLVSCSGPAPATPPTVTIQRLPPTPRDIIDALLASSRVPLSVHSSCREPGPQSPDRTIGRYLSGFLAELSDPEAKNAIETSAEPRVTESGESVWLCRVMIRHAKGEDIWRWGVEFSVRQKDGVVMNDSFRCLGAG